MKRQWMLILCLMMMLLVLTGCSSERPDEKMAFPETTQYLGPVTVTDAPTPEPDPEPVADESTSVFSDNPYDVVDFTAEDALSEENYVDPFADDGYTDNGSNYAASADATVYPYAGSTPIPLVPIDMPSPTPRAELSFANVEYSAGSLGLTFEAPSGWLVDNTLTDVFVLTEPETDMHDGYQCTLTLSAIPVNTDYSEKDLKKQVTDRLKAIGSLNFVEWDPSLTAKRHLLGANGIYANYSGTLANGVKVGGRILYACLNNRLYGLEVAYPLEYREDYLNVFNHIRDTISAK